MNLFALTSANKNNLNSPNDLEDPKKLQEKFDIVWKKRLIFITTPKNIAMRVRKSWFSRRRAEGSSVGQSIVARKQCP